MFGVCLQYCLEFIGVQAPDDGCSSAQLNEFICQDVLPCQGWASNETLRNTIVRLLLTTHEDQFDLYAEASVNRHAGATEPGARRGRSEKTTPPVDTLSSRKVQRRRVSVQEAVDFLDSGRLAWRERIECIDGFIEGNSQLERFSLPLEDAGDRALLYFIPSHALRERVMGYPIRNETLDTVSRFIAENAVLGWDRLPSTSEFKARYKSHLVSSGLKFLRRVHKVTLVYMYQVPSREVVYRFFPHFALPLTEREKKEHLVGVERGRESFRGGGVSCSNDGFDSTASAECDQLYGEWSLGGAGGGGGMSATPPVSLASSLQRHRSGRQNHPLHRYYARRRSRDSAFPGVTFDLELVRQMVLHSPDRRLLMQDAVHAVLAAHGLFLNRWEDFSRTERMHVRRLISAAGLRIVTASATLRGHLRELRLVIPSEDLARQVRAASASAPSSGCIAPQVCVGAGGGTGGAGDVAGSLYGPGSSGGVDNDAADLPLDDTGRSGKAALRSQHVVAPVMLRPDPAPGRVDESDVAEFDDDDVGSDDVGFKDSGDDENGGEQGDEAQTQAAVFPLQQPSTRRQQLEAFAVLRVEANHALELQAAQEAERRPLSLTATVPRIRFHLSYKQRGKVLFPFFERYAKMRGTLATCYLLLQHTKVFTLVYTPRQLATSPAQGVCTVDAPAATAVKRGQDDVLLPGKGVGVAAAVDRVTEEVTELSSSLRRMLHFVPNDSRLPKGLSAYAVNTVLDVLVHAAPYHAASVPRLAQSIDVSTLSRRVLPLLRQLRYVYTTAVVQRGRKHVGLVVLVATEGETGPTTLSDAAKRAVLEAEAAAELAGRSARQSVTLSAVSGKAIPSGMVLTSVPVVLEGGRRSTLSERLVEVHPATTKAVNRVMAVRNGYARSLVQRISRLHLELWHQHYLYPIEDTVPSATTDSSGVCVREMYARMTLSTFVIVVGLPQADLGFVVDRGGGVCGWSTPLRDLPPSVYGWCMQRGAQMLLASLHELQTRRLIRLTQGVLDNCLSPEACDVVRYTLVPQCTVDGYTHHFMSAPPTAAASLYACMRYWLPFWCAIGRPSRRLDPLPSALQANITVPQVLSLSKILRQDPSVLGAQLYQSGGLPLESRLSVSLAAVGDIAVMHGTGVKGFPGRDGTVSTTSMLVHPLHGRGRDARGVSPTAPVPYGGQRVAPKRLCKAARTEINGRTVAEALESAFYHFSPIKRVEDLVRFVLRGRGVHLSHHPLFCVPAALPTLLLGRQKGAEANSTLSPQGCGVALPTEFNVMGTGQGGSAYNRLVSVSTMHMAALAETLRTVRSSNAVVRARHSQRSSLTEALFKEVEGVYAPQVAALPASTGAATTNCETVQPSAALGSSSPFTHRAVAQPSCSPKVSRSLLQVEAGFEVVADMLRMILFSDQAHYRASVARSLLTALNKPWMVTRARAFLQRMPVFRRTRQKTVRVPQLSLARSPYVLPISALRTAPLPCANLAMLHQWAQEADAVGGALAGGRESPTLLWARPEMNSLLALDAQATVQRTPPLPLSLRHQPSMDPADMSMAPNAVRHKMTQLPLPQLAWPAEAVACEGLSWRQSLDRGGRADCGESGVAIGTVSTRRSRKHSKRRRFSAARAGDEASSEEEGRNSASESSDEDADSVAVTRPQAETARRLYPARSLRHFGDPPYLQDLPIDGPPAAAEQRAVEACREALSSGAFLSLSPFLSGHGDGCIPHGCGLIPYPSIFHHVDGRWHSYMWHLVVHTVYRYILRVPGIRHADLEARLLASGVLSRRALWTVLRFLVDHQLLICQEEELAQPLYTPGSGVFDGPPKLRSPFQRRKRLRTDSGASLPPLSPARSGEPDSPRDEKDSDSWLGSTLGCCCYHPTLAIESLRLVLSPGLFDALLA